MRSATETRVERLEAATQPRNLYVVLDTLPDDDFDAGHVMTPEEWESTYCQNRGGVR